MTIIAKECPMAYEDGCNYRGRGEVIDAVNCPRRDVQQVYCPMAEEYFKERRRRVYKMPEDFGIKMEYEPRFKLES